VAGNRCSFTQTVELDGSGSPIGAGQLLSMSALADTAELRFSMQNCTIRAFGNLTKSGGALQLELLSEVALADIQFVSNVGLMGGAVSLESCNHVSVTACSFLRNIASLGGGLYVGQLNTDVVITDTYFVSNTVSYALRGSGLGGGLYVYAFNEDLQITRCRFENNTAQDSGGGAYIGISNNNVELSLCRFLRNGAKGIGGGLFVKSDNIFSLEACEFSFNAAPNLYGGGVYVYSRNIMTITNSIFFKNKALYGELFAVYTLRHMVPCHLTLFNAGGALNADSDNDFAVLANCSFRENSADYGAAVTFYASHVYLFLELCSFDSNIASNSGGALYFGKQAYRRDIIDCIYVINIILCTQGSTTTTAYFRTCSSLTTRLSRTEGLSYSLPPMSSSRSQGATLFKTRPGTRVRRQYNNFNTIFVFILMFLCIYVFVACLHVAGVLLMDNRRRHLQRPVHFFLTFRGVLMGPQHCKFFRRSLLPR
jgi:predicted outer membrane repeat protein